MSNSILKSFNPVQDFEKSSNYLYVSLFISKNDVASKSVKYVKVCVLKSENLLKPNFNHAGYAKSYENMLYRNRVNLINQFEFEDQPINLNLEGPLLSPGDPLLRRELDHTFKIYFLDKNKKIVESEEFKLPEGFRISEYNPVDIDDVIENILQSSIDIDLRDYSEDFTDGPFVKYSDSLNEIQEFNLSNVSINFNFNTKNYVFKNASLLSILMIISYKSGIVFDLKEYFKTTQDDQVSLDVFFNYNNVSIKKQLIVTRLKIESLYNTYFKRFKRRFLNDSFSEKFEVNLNDSIVPSLKLRLIKPNLEFFPLSEDNLKISITKNVNGLSSQISNVYTTESLSEESKIISAANFNFNFETLYNSMEVSEEKTFYIKCPDISPITANLTIKLNNETIYPQETLNSSSNKLFNVYPTIESKAINFFGNKVLKNNKLSKNGIRALIDYEKINQTSDALKTLGYKTDGNDYLAQNIIDNTIVKYTIRQKNSSGEVIEETRYERMSDVTKGEEILIDNKKSKKNTKVSLSTITLPDTLLNKMTSINESSDDDKESIASYLNKAIPNSFRKIDALISTKLFDKSSNKSEKEIFQSIFDINNEESEITIIEDDEENTPDILDEDSVEDQAITLESVPLGDILNVSSSSDEDLLFFESFLYYTTQQNYLKVFKRKRDRIVAKVDMTKIFEELNVRSTDVVSFNVEKLITLEFDRENFTRNRGLDDFIYNDSVMIIEDSYFIFKNITSFLKDNFLHIKNNNFKEVIEISEDAYENFYNVWGRNNTLYINNMLERYVITIFVNDRIKRVMKINNYIEKDYSLLESIENKTYLLNSDLHMPNIKVEFRKPREDN